MLLRRKEKRVTLGIGILCAIAKAADSAAKSVLLHGVRTGNVLLIKMRRVVFFLLVNLISFGCEVQKSSESEMILGEFSERFNYLRNGHWDVMIEWSDEQELTINATKRLNDTLLSVRLHKHKITKDSVSLSFIEANRIFSQDSRLIDYQRLDENFKIMYWYKFDSVKEDQKVFVVGQYYYQYLESLLNESQIDYFLKHLDSLKLITGDNLKSLPGK